MKRVVNDERLMLKVCELYYFQDKSQQEIANALGISRPTVSRLLRGAREKGVVRIIIPDISGRNYMDVEEKLMQKYGLKQAVVAEQSEDMERQCVELGAVAARFLERILKDGDTVGVAMGTALSCIALHVTAQHFQNLTFLPIIGGVGMASMELHSNHIAESLAKAFGGNFLPLHAPAMVSSVGAKNVLLQEESIATVLKKASRLDVAISGIGAPIESSTTITSGYFGSEAVEKFQENNICGDICMRFYDKNGNLSNIESNQQTFGIDIELLRKVPWSIGVAGGIRKASAIRGALAGKYINTLITDIGCAALLLDS